MAADLIYVRGEGGMVIAMSHPLGEGIEKRLTRGELRRVNEDGSPYTGDSEDGGPTAITSRPAQSASKDEWVGWAVTNGATPDDAAAMTKADLIDRYGKGDA
ncbi:hypothetical protein [Streptomyces sp. NPDC020983]|uniref:hypothetical protein n=1 Tax=Streptomyces sp. NPDC020983 TaxID=3365106 RepID=UPI00379E989D